MPQTLIASWILDLYLKSLAQPLSIATVEISRQRTVLQAEVRQFMKDFQHLLPLRLTLDLCETYGQRELSMHYCVLRGDFPHQVAFRLEVLDFDGILGILEAAVATALARPDKGDNDARRKQRRAARDVIEKLVLDNASLLIIKRPQRLFSLLRREELN